VAQSPEYPDLKWVPPRSWTDANRTKVQLIVIHTTEGSAHSNSAEDGAAYDARRTDGTSAHYFVDNTSVVQCVRTADQAHTARRQGNRRGIQYELCGRAAFSAPVWAGDYAQAMLRRTAKQAARDAKKWGIPVRHLTVAQVRAGLKGFCSHWDITRAFPEDGGTHTDPGPNFPWSQFLGMVRAELAPPKPEPEEPTVATPTWSDQTVLDLNFLFREAWRSIQDDFPAEPLPAGPDRNARNIRNYLVGVVQAAVEPTLDTLVGDVDTLTTKVDSLTAEPGSGDNPLVDVIRYAIANPDVGTGSGG
jgi:N-acetyl-anhydromuramyl-L-alanine amidase AmpD